MYTRGTRRLRDGREVDIGRNEGLRKVCRCGRKRWSKCPHPWHFSFQWEGEHYRFSLERHVGRKLTKAEAEAEAERLRTAIRAGEFQAAQERARQPKPQPPAASAPRMSEPPAPVTRLRTVEEAAGWVKRVVSPAATLKVCQLMMAPLEFVMVRVPPAPLIVAEPDTTVGPVGLASTAPAASSAAPPKLLVSMDGDPT